jgi:broad specificity phosphatase PhoE
LNISAPAPSRAGADTAERSRERALTPPSPAFPIHHALPRNTIRIRRLAREDAELLGTSPGLKRGAEDGTIDPRAAAHVPDAVRRTPTRLTSMDPSAYDDVALSPGELGGSQYIMSPGHELASSLQRSESTMSDGRTATAAASAEDVAAAMDARASNQRLFPIFVRGRKVVHLVRHGQSTYNEAISGPGSWDEPNIFDAPLTKLGARQAKGLGAFLSKLPKDAVWVTSPLTRAMETCVHGYKSSLEVAAAQRRKAAAMSEAAGGGAPKSVGGEGKPPSGRAAWGEEQAVARRRKRGAGGDASARERRERMRGDGGRGRDASAPVRADEPRERSGLGGVGVNLLLRGESSRFSETNGACDEQTPAAATLRRLGSDAGELGTDAIGASPSETLEPDAAEMSSWGERVIVHPHLSEKLATSGDIGRCKGVLMNEFPLLGLSLSRLPGDVWWYNRPHHPNDAERRLFQSHEPTAKFKERVATFRHWLMSREDKTFVVFGHSTFFKELVGGNRSLKNCEVHTYHL